MAPNWTPEKLKRLLELFDENYNCLFHRHMSRHQRKVRMDTFQKIAKELDMPLQSLKFKYFNLNNAYNVEVKKIEAAKSKGFFYRPTLPWFKKYREIMDKVDEINSNDMHNMQEEEMEDITRQEEESEEELEYEDEEPPETHGADTIVVSIKQEFIDGEKKGSWDVDFDESPQTVQSIELPKSSPTVDPAQISRIAYVKKATKRPYKDTSAQMSSGIDEFQMFANHVAEQLRNMTYNSARKMQNEIHTIFDEEGFPFYSPVLDE